MAYVAVVKALYDYAAQDPETELSLKEDQIAYVIEKEDDDWWKAKLKSDDGEEEGGIGLIPVSYVEELPPINTTRALYAYTSTSSDELSMEEDAVLQVFSIEEDWLLVRVEGGGEHLGLVPRTYCEPLDESQQVEVADAAEAEADLEEQRQQDAADARAREASERQRQLKLKDKVETWSVSQMEGKKKKKGTLGVGNGAVFFASDTDKVRSRSSNRMSKQLTAQSPVQQLSITDLESVSSASSKEIQLSFASLSSPLHFHCGGSDSAKAILAKLETSKEAAGEALRTVAAEEAAADSDDQGYEPKAVRFAPTSGAAPARGAASSGEPATVLYDFDAAGEDELDVKENDTVTVVDKENDEWWLVRNSRGQEGVVPAQYIQISDGSAPAGGVYGQVDEEEEARKAEEEAAAQRRLDAERQRERAKQAEQRRAIEQAAREKQAQEEEDRQIALELERKEVEKSIKRQQARIDEDEIHSEQVSARRREVARHQAPPKVARRPSANDVAAAAARLPDRGRAPPDRPPENNRPKPNPGRIRVWSDKSGQFKVEAEYLGLNGNKIRLHKTNGVIIEVPIDKMSQEDVQMIKRHEARRQQRRAVETEDDDVPLGRTPRKGQSSRSEESRARGEEPIPAAAMEQPKPRKPRYDWFAFFLESGCSMDDCTRYAANFERDRIDETLLPDLEASTLRSLGLKEGDVIRVRKEIQVRFAKKTPEQEAQIKQDEDYARQLQEYERSGGKGPVPQPPPALFTTGPSGKLANNTRRGRPERKGTDTVDASAIAAAGDQLSKMNTGGSASPVLLSPSPPLPKQEKPAAPPALIPGFDDDAWTIKPSSKPASPAPPASTPAASLPPVVNGNRAATSAASGTDSLLAQIHALRPAATGMSSNNTGGSFGQGQQQQQVQPNQTGFNNAAQYGLGQQGVNQPMSQMMINPNGPRGPLAPVAANEPLLNPLQPTQTGMFIPTRGNAVSPIQQGMMPQATGFGMMPQQTGYASGFQQGYGQMQPSYTGVAGPGQQVGQTMYQQASSTFGAIANMGPPQQPQQQQQPQGDKFAPGNIFAAMKRADFAKPEEQRPQDSGKYDALRPLTTGYNGGPGMMPQPTGYGMMPQPTGKMGMQQTGLGMGMGMMPQQPTGFIPQQQQGMMGPQMTGYNPYAGQQYGGQYR